MLACFSCSFQFSRLRETELNSPPVLQALVLADHIYTDESGKRIICGTFSRIWCRKFPTTFGRPTFAFVLLADVVGTLTLQLRFVHLKDNRILMQSPSIVLQSQDPLTPVDLAIEIPPFPLPEEGVYSFECWADNELIGSVRLNVSKVTEGQETSDA